MTLSAQLKKLLLCSLLVLLLPISVQAANDKALEAMREGGVVLMIRHALAPGIGDPEDFTLGDCTTQRNLNDEGRAQAKVLGEWLRKHGITKVRLYSSQWCRCMETARLMNFGDVTPLPALNSFLNVHKIAIQA